VAVGTSQAEAEAIINKLVAGAGTPAAVTP